MRTWKIPPRIKVYEALGCIGDRRISVRGYRATVASSSGRKMYQVRYDPKTKAIVANDNGSYWRGYIGYPAIAFLMKKGILPYNHRTSTMLRDIRWKTLNTKFEDDYTKTIIWVEREVVRRGGSPTALRKIVSATLQQLRALCLRRLPFDLPPPGE